MEDVYAAAIATVQQLEDEETKHSEAKGKTGAEQAGKAIGSERVDGKRRAMKVIDDKSIQKSDVYYKTNNSIVMTNLEKRSKLSEKNVNNYNTTGRSEVKSCIQV